jgi:hypothetical protein
MLVPGVHRASCLFDPACILAGHREQTVKSWVGIRPEGVVFTSNPIYTLLIWSKHPQNKF